MTDYIITAERMTKSIGSTDKPFFGDEELKSAVVRMIHRFYDGRIENVDQLTETEVLALNRVKAYHDVTRGFTYTELGAPTTNGTLYPALIEEHLFIDIIAQRIRAEHLLLGQGLIDFTLEWIGRGQGDLLAG